MKYLSPSSINCYLSCPRSFFNTYILGIRPDKNVAMVKGIIVHTVLYNMFQPKYYPKDLKDRLCKDIEKELKQALDNKEIKIGDYNSVKKEIDFMVEMFRKKTEDMINAVMLDGKIQSKTHAWNFIRPKFREQKIINETLQLQGIIDTVEKTFNDKIIIVDYKTSKLYKHSVSDEYIRQLSLYALLYFEEHKEMPDYVAIHYLRYGLVYFFPVTKQTLEEAKETIKFVQENVQSTKMQDYPKHDGERCMYCGEY